MLIRIVEPFVREGYYYRGGNAVYELEEAYAQELLDAGLVHRFEPLVDPRRLEAAAAAPARREKAKAR